MGFTAGGTWYTTYTRVPHYITSYQRSLLLESLEYAVFDMTSADSITIELDSNVMTGRIIPGEYSSRVSVYTNWYIFVLNESIMQDVYLTIDCLLITDFLAYFNEVPPPNSLVCVCMCIYLFHVCRYIDALPSDP